MRQLEIVLSAQNSGESGGDSFAGAGRHVGVMCAFSRFCDPFETVPAPLAPRYDSAPPSDGFLFGNFSTITIGGQPTKADMREVSTIVSFLRAPFS